MTLVSNDPSYWPYINSYRVTSYVKVATFVGVTYDWALTLGQEVELVWRQHWSLMSILYLSLRYLGILFVVLDILMSVPAILLTDAGCLILYLIYNWTNVVAFAMLCVIMITRLHAMYERSRRILIFLIVIFFAVNIFDGVAAIMLSRHTSGEELVLSGTYHCTIAYANDALLLNSVTWMLGTVWEVLVLCLAVWIAVKHIREMRQHSSGGIVVDYLTVLIKTHVVYFSSFVAVSCLILIYDYTPTMLADQFSLETQIFLALFEILTVIQSFVLGPRLILGVREYHAQLLADSDAATGVASIAFQERVHISTSSGV